MTSTTDTHKAPHNETFETATVMCGYIMLFMVDDGWNDEQMADYFDRVAQSCRDGSFRPIYDNVIARRARKAATA